MLKKLALAALVGAAIVGVAGCGGSSNKAASGAASGNSNITIGFSVSTQNNPFFVTMADSVKEAASKAGVNVKIVDAQNDPAKQSNDVADLIQSKVSVLIINPVDSSAISNSVIAANDAKIPVITVDRSSDQGDVAVHIASNNVKGGEMAADYIAKKLGDKAAVAELEGIPGASATRERGEGFKKGADAHQLQILASQNADFDRSKGMTVAENMLQANPDIKAIFAENDEMALGAASAAKSANKQLLIIGFDGTADGIKAIQNGDLTATIAQQPDKMGEIAVDSALKLARHENVEKNVAVDLKLVEKN